MKKILLFTLITIISIIPAYAEISNEVISPEFQYFESNTDFFEFGDDIYHYDNDMIYEPIQDEILLKVEIFSDVSNPYFGQLVALYSTVISSPGAYLTYQWQVDQGNGWEDIRDANNEYYIFTYNRNNANYYWRLVVKAY